MFYLNDKSVVFTGLKHGSSQLAKIIEDEGWANTGFGYTKFISPREDKDLPLQWFKEKRRPFVFIIRNPNKVLRSALITDLHIFLKENLPYLMVKHKAIFNFIECATKENLYKGELTLDLLKWYSNTIEIFKIALNEAIESDTFIFKHISVFHLTEVFQTLSFTPSWKNKDLMYSTVLFNLDDYPSEDIDMLIDYKILHKGTSQKYISSTYKHDTKSLQEKIEPFFNYAARQYPAYMYRQKSESAAYDAVINTYSRLLYNTSKFKKIVGY